MSPPASPSPSDGSGGSGESDAAEATNGSDGDGGVEAVLTLPDELREAFKEPFGPVFTDAGALLEAIEKPGPIVAVGDVVTYHLVEAGRRPDVAVLDGYTERTPVAEGIEAGTDTDAYDTHIRVENPAAVLTAGILDVLAAALANARAEGVDRADEGVEPEGGGQGGETTVIDVNGEEDLVTVPAIVAAPESASVVYGQPGEGMVRVPVEEDIRRRARELLERMDGDHERAWELLRIAVD
jgi:uncharacterized protein (UPF0218 family)